MLSRVASQMCLLLCMALHQSSYGFVVDVQSSKQSARAAANTVTRLAMAEKFQVAVSMPPSDSNLQAQMNFQPVLSVPSEIIQVRYQIPFGLDVAPQNNLAVCTKDGKGGEKAGDVLRFTSQWTLGLPRGDGLATMAASFAGGLSWQCSMFDVAGAGQWEEVVEALTSNVADRTDEVVLLFERALKEPSEE